MPKVEREELWVWTPDTYGRPCEQYSMEVPQELYDRLKEAYEKFLSVNYEITAIEREKG